MAGLKIPETPVYVRKEDALSPNVQLIGKDEFNEVTKAGMLLGQAGQVSAYDSAKVFEIARQYRKDKETSLDVMRNYYTSALEKDKLYERYKATANGTNSEEQQKELQDELRQINSRYTEGKDPEFLFKWDKLVTPHDYGIRSKLSYAQAAELSTGSIVEAKAVNGVTISNAVRLAHAGFNLESNLQMMKDQQDLLLTQHTEAQKREIELEGQYRLVDEVTVALLKSKATRGDFIKRMSDPKEAEKWFSKAAPGRQAEYMGMMEAEKKKVAVDGAIEILEKKFNLKSYNGNYSGAHLYLMDADNRKALGIDFDQAHQIMTGIHATWTNVGETQRQQQQEKNKAIADEYFKMQTEGNGRGAEMFIREKLKKGEIDGGQAYDAIAHVLAQRRSAGAEGRAITSFGWQTEKHSVETFIENSAADVMKGAKQGTGADAVMTFKKKINELGGPNNLTKEDVKMVKNQILQSDSYYKGETGNKLDNVLGTKPTYGTTGESAGTPYTKPTILNNYDGLTVKNKKTGEMQRFNSKTQKWEPFVATDKKVK